MTNPSIDTIDHEKGPFAHLVAGEALRQDATDHCPIDRAAMESVLADPALLREPLIGRRPVHGLGDAVALTKLFLGESRSCRTGASVRARPSEANP